jgi:transcriptional regulator with XRE-family HTH domain
MGLHIGNSYRPATFNCMKGKSDKGDLQRGSRIRSLRKALELNQVELAESVDQSTVSDMERGSSFSADLLMRLSKVLGTSPGIIMEGRDEAAWPFRRVVMADFVALASEDRAYIEGILANEIDKLSVRPTPEDMELFKTAVRQKTARTARRKAA